MRFRWHRCWHLGLWNFNPQRLNRRTVSCRVKFRIVRHICGCAGYGNRKIRGVDMCEYRWSLFPGLRPHKRSLKTLIFVFYLVFVVKVLFCFSESTLESRGIGRAILIRSAKMILTANRVNPAPRCMLYFLLLGRDTCLSATWLRASG